MVNATRAASRARVAAGTVNVRGIRRPRARTASRGLAVTAGEDTGANGRAPGRERAERQQGDDQEQRAGNRPREADGGGPRSPGRHGRAAADVDRGRRLGRLGGGRGSGRRRPWGGGRDGGG